MVRLHFPQLLWVFLRGARLHLLLLLRIGNLRRLLELLGTNLWQDLRLTAIVAWLAMRCRLWLHLSVHTVRAPHRNCLDNFFATRCRSILLRQIHRVHSGFVRAVLVRNADIGLRWVHARGAVHLFVHTHAVVTNVALISNLGTDAPLVERTRREPSLTSLHPADLSTVDFTLVAHRLLR